MSFGLGYSEIERDYKSWEIKKRKDDKVYIRFQINVPYVLEFLHSTQDLLKKKIENGETTDIEKYNKALKSIEQSIVIMKKNRSVQNVWITGSFNDWKVKDSRIPNELVPSDDNLDTYYTRTLVPFKVGKSQYKFVINYGAYTNTQGKILNEYIIVDDPTIEVKFE